MRWLGWYRNGFWLLLIISLAFNAGFGTTFGVRTYQHRCRDAGHGEDASLQSLHEKLNLTPEQQAWMRAAKEKLFEQIDKLRRKLTPEREALAGLLAAPEPDRAAITVQLDRIAALQRQVQQRVVEHLLEEKELLAPEQREAFNEIIRRRVCPHGGHGPESIPGGCEDRARSGHADGDGYNGEDGP